MARSRRRNVPITVNASSKQTTTSSLHTRSVIRKFHSLLKSRHRIAHDANNPSRQRKLGEIDTQIDQLGGLDVYQHMSKLGQSTDRGGGTQKVFITWLNDLGLRPSHPAAPKLRLLEVGALTPNNYRSCQSWIENTPIDLKAQHPSILEQDFLKMDHDENRERWDLISLSLVLNFVPNARDRGRMLRLTYTMLKLEGLLFLALPLPCLQNSRYLSPEHLMALMQHVGFCLVQERWKADGKMAYWLFRKEESGSTSSTNQFQKKMVLRGGNRNNFAIIL